MEFKFKTIMGEFLLNDSKGISLENITEEQAISIIGRELNEDYLLITKDHYVCEIITYLKLKGITDFDGKYILNL